MIFRFFLLFLFIAFGQTEQCLQNGKYSKWCRVLQRHVATNQTRHKIPLSAVNYKDIAKDHEFWEFLKDLEKTNISGLDHDQFYSLFMNAYNAFAIKMVVENPCQRDLFGKCGSLKSIRDVGSYIPYHPVWKKKIGVIGGTDYSLNDIENHIRKPNDLAEDSRLHACIVGASISSPDLLNVAYEPLLIDQQMTESLNRLLSNTKKGMKVNQSKNLVYLSPIFEWFKDDFRDYSSPQHGSANGTVLGFISLFISPSHPDAKWIQAHVSEDDIKIRHFGFDWDLNSQKGVPCSSSERPCYPLWAFLVTLGGVVLASCITCCACYIVRRNKQSHTYHRINEADLSD